MSLQERPGRPDPIALASFVVEDHVGYWLRRAYQRYGTVFQEMMAGHDLTAPQYAALSKTVELGHGTQNHLGRLTAMDPATIQGVVRRLTERGLLARTSDPMDRRTVVLRPTEAGRALVAATVELARGAHAALLAPLTETEQQQLLALLRRMV